MSCHLFKPRKIILLFLLICFLIGGCIGLSYHNLAYDKLSRQIFQNELSGNTLTLHYTLKDSGKYGMEKESPTLPLYSKERQAAAAKACQQYLTSLQSIPMEKLTGNRPYDYHLVKRFFTLQNQLNNYPYYQEPCTPGSGMQTTLPILLSEFRFYEKEDIITYLSLLSQVDEYFESLAQFEKEKKAAGLFMSDESALQVIQECEDYAGLSNNPDTHFLVCSFESRLEQWCSEHPHVLSEAEIQSFCAQNREIIQQQLRNGYLNLAEAFRKLEGDKPVPSGLGATAEGQTYYTLLLRKNTGSYRGMKEIEQLLFEQFDTLCLALQKIDPSSCQGTAAKQWSPEEMLETLQQDMCRDYPAFPKTEADYTPTCTIKSVDEALANYSAPAFYLVPPIDDYKSNTIYINPQNNLTGSSLFTTLAHEGYPGHFYQTVYMHQLNLYPPSNPVRSLLNYEGYCEGWALYVELESYRYAEKYYPICADLHQTSRVWTCAYVRFWIFKYTIVI